MTNFAEMGKTELRAACKDVGVKGYGNMTNDGMRAALIAKAATLLAAGEPAEQMIEHTDLNAEAAALAEAATVAELNAARDAVVPAPAAPTPKLTGLKIEANRERRNGVTRPSVGGKCRAIWDALDEYVADEANEGAKPTAAVIKAIAAEEGWDKTTTMIQFYQWRKFNGITGRSK